MVGGITDSMDVSLSELRELVMDRRPDMLQRVRLDRATELIIVISCAFMIQFLDEKLMLNLLCILLYSTKYLELMFHITIRCIFIYYLCHRFIITFYLVFHDIYFYNMKNHFN